MISRKSALLPSPVAQAHLEVRLQGGIELRFPLPDGGFVAGRVIDCDVQLDHPMVSRQHVRFDPVAGGGWRVTDLKSHNGTRVNDVVQREAIIKAGDRIDIGPYTLILCVPDPLDDLDPPSTISEQLTLSDEAVSVNSLREIEPPTIAVDQLRVLNEFSQTLHETPDADQRLLKLCKLMLHQKLGALWAVVALVNSASPEELPEALLPVELASPQQNMQVHLSRTLLNAVCNRREPVLACNTSGAVGSRVELSVTPDEMAIAAIAVPLFDAAEGHAVSAQMKVLYVVFPQRYGTGEWLALCSLAVQHHRHAGVVWANTEQKLKFAVIERDLERARNLQHRLVPQDANLSGLDVAIHARPCHAVGGDYVDALQLPGQSLLVIADVCGKGLPAAMVAMGLHTLVHSASRRWTGFPDLIESIDAHLPETLNHDAFVTLLALTIDSATGEIQSVNAGHPAAVVVQTDGEIRRVGECGGYPLNCDPQTLEVETARLRHGDLLILFTDGCFEINDESGEMMGLEKLFTRIAKEVKGRTPQQAAATIIQMLNTLQDPSMQADDQTLLIAQLREPD